MWTKAGEQEVLISLESLSIEKGSFMNRSMRVSMKEMNNGQMRGSPTSFEPETSISHRFRKQRQRLLKLREHILKEVQQLKAEACEEVPNYSMHMADAATDSFDRDLVLGLASFEQEGLYEIDAALKRLEDGSYGVCELTGKPIPWERLEAIPWTRFSLEAENQLEGHMCPHIGRLGTIRPAEKEKSKEALGGAGDEEPEFTTDLDLSANSLELVVKALRESADQPPNG